MHEATGLRNYSSPGIAKDSVIPGLWYHAISFDHGSATFSAEIPGIQVHFTVISMLICQLLWSVGIISITFLSLINMNSPYMLIYRPYLSMSKLELPIILTCFLFYLWFILNMSSFQFLRYIQATIRLFIGMRFIGIGEHVTDFHTIRSAKMSSRPTGNCLRWGST